MNRNSGKVLDINSFSHRRGTSIQRHSFAGGNNQLWPFQPTTGGYLVCNSDPSTAWSPTAGAPPPTATLPGRRPGTAATRSSDHGGLARGDLVGEDPGAAAEEVPARPAHPDPHRLHRRTQKFLDQGLYGVVIKAVIRGVGSQRRPAHNSSPAW
ncbi:RICIN domain-containing protein [Streptomyces sp. NPDC006476]|uniref:RICIN domain-containing protein n=1 Tax=Streptomyces sp. NPDC006476 TaxID=3157175 RepID=UPI0033AF502A